MSEKNIFRYISAILILGKIRITIPITLTALTGFILFKGRLHADIIAPALGVFLLASGAAVLNHYQEIAYDALMKRTKNRPLPAGEVKPSHALLLSIFLSIAGSLILLFGANIQAMLLGLATLVWYNFIYTYLKRITAFAVVPGSVVGALPPMIGWAAANGDLLDPRILITAFFFFIGQIPHFWLVLLTYGKEYEDAGLPSISKILNEKQLQNLTLIWALATVCISLLLPLYHVIESYYLSALTILLASILAINFIYQFVYNEQGLRNKYTFMKINIFYLLIMVIIWVDVLI